MFRITQLVKILFAILLTASLITGCIALLTELNSISSIRAVAARVRTPSGLKNTKSLPISCILPFARHPMFSVIGVTATVEELFIFCNLCILFKQNIIKSSRKDFNPTILSSITILPEPVDEKSSMSFVPE